MKKLIIWDIDGTLLWTNAIGRKALEKTFLEEYGIEHALNGISLSGKLDGNVLDEITHKFAIKLDLMKFNRQYCKNLHFYYDQGVEWGHIPGIKSILRLLNHDKNVINTIGTGNLYSGAKIKLQKAGLSGFFEDGAYGDDGGSRTELVRRAMKRFEYWNYDQCFVIGDTEDDLIAAYENRIEAIGVVAPERMNKVKKTYNYPIVENYLDKDRILSLLNVKR